MIVASEAEPDVESVFARALGRALSDEERARLLRLKDAFDLRPNDPLWVCAMMHESYDSIFRQYPQLCAETVRRALTDWLASPEGMAAAVRSRTRPPAPGGPGAAGLQESRRLQPGPNRDLYLVTVGGLATASLVLVGAVCFAAGAAMQSRGLPFWVRPSPSALAVALGGVLGAPAGWIVLVALFMPAVYAGTWGWGRGRNGRTKLDRRLGWAACTAATTGVIGWFAMVTWVMLG